MSDEQRQGRDMRPNRTGPNEKLPGWAIIMELQVEQEIKRKRMALEIEMAKPGYSERVKESNRKYFEEQRRLRRLNEG